MSESLNSGMDRVKSGWEWLRTAANRAGATVAATDRRTLGGVIAAIVVLIVIYYPAGMLIYDGIDDNVDLQPAPPYAVSGGSQAVAMAATLAAREADTWIANKPFWHPSALLDDKPNFQLGVMYAVSRFALELGDYLARVRGSSAIDPNVDKAVGYLRYDGTTWYWGQGNIIPTAKAESQYRKGVDLLLTYNRDLGAGKSTFDRRADNLIVFLDRVAADLGSSSAELDVRAEAGGGYFDSKADDVFYNVKGKMYGYYTIMRALGDDFGPIIREKQAGEIWNNMLGSLRTGATMSPLIVVNGRQDSLLMPSHLSTLGFYLLRARTQLRELSDTLQK
jgi:hypothetical protein